MVPDTNYLMYVDISKQNYKTSLHIKKYVNKLRLNISVNTIGTSVDASLVWALENAY